jgi:hypothetical protein
MQKYKLKSARGGVVHSADIKTAERNLMKLARTQIREQPLHIFHARTHIHRREANCVQQPRTHANESNIRERRKNGHYLHSEH